MLDSSWNVMAHGDTREGKWRRNWQMEWVASTFTLPRNMVHPALLPLMRTARLPVFDWIDVPADLNGLVRFAERRKLVSASVPSHFNWPLQVTLMWHIFTSQGNIFEQWNIIVITYTSITNKMYRTYYWKFLRNMKNCKFPLLL